jgi:hypothetical protein
MAEVAELEQALDRLYGVDLDEFVPARKQLAKELKESGEKVAAETIAAARKPTVAGWVLNQLARRRRKDIDLLLDAGHRVRQAQASLLRGEEPSAFTAARKVEQTTVAKLAKEARSLLAERGTVSQATIDQVTQSLRAAAVSEEGRHLLARGRFEKPFTEPGGFDALAAIAPKGPRKQAARKLSSRDALREAKAELRDAQKREQQLQREAAAAEADASRLKKQLEEAEQRAEDAGRAVADAASAVAKSERRLRAAEKRSG